jgi:hypothetical protein
MMEAKSVSETLLYLKHVIWLMARDDIIKVCYSANFHESEACPATLAEERLHRISRKSDNRFSCYVTDGRADEV